MSKRKAPKRRDRGRRGPGGAGPNPPARSALERRRVEVNRRRYERVAAEMRGRPDCAVCGGPSFAVATWERPADLQRALLTPDGDTSMISFRICRDCCLDPGAPARFERRFRDDVARGCRSDGRHAHLLN